MTALILKIERFHTAKISNLSKRFILRQMVLHVGTQGMSPLAKLDGQIRLRFITPVENTSGF